MVRLMSPLKSLMEDEGVGNKKGDLDDDLEDDYGEGGGEEGSGGMAGGRFNITNNGELTFSFS